MQCVFLKSPPRPLCCAVLKYTLGMSLIALRTAVNGHRKQKAPNAEEGIFRFCKAAGHGNTRRILKGGSAAKPANSPRCGSLYSDCIVYTIKSICRRESRVTLKAPYLRFSKPLRRFSTCLGAALLTHFLIHTLLIHNNMPLFLP